MKEMPCPRCDHDLNAPIDTPLNMLLRDYFAAAALTGLMANDRTSTSSSLVETDAPNIAQAAYTVADAMLKARGE